MTNIGNARLDDRLKQLRTNGFCVLEKLIPEGDCAFIRDSVLNTVSRHRLDEAPARIGFVPSVINYNQSFATYLANAELLELVAAILGQHIRISFTSAIINEPGNGRGQWHADWPHNQKNAGHLPAPYPDTVVHLTTLWMLSPFTKENGGTLIRPGSHRLATNPTQGSTSQCLLDDSHESPTPINADGEAALDANRSFADETQLTGPAGSIAVFDSRLWHAASPNQGTCPRVALAVRYAPWWLNLEVLRPESGERERMCAESGKTDNSVPSLPAEVFQGLPDDVRPLYRHWVAAELEAR